MGVLRGVKRRIKIDEVNAAVGKDCRQTTDGPQRFRVLQPLRQKRRCRVSASLRLQIVAEPSRRDAPAMYRVQQQRRFIPAECSNVVAGEASVTTTNRLRRGRRHQRALALLPRAACAAGSLVSQVVNDKFVFVHVSFAFGCAPQGSVSEVDARASVAFGEIFLVASAKVSDSTLEHV